MPTLDNPATNQLNRYNGIVNMYNYDAAGNQLSSGTSDIGGHSFTYNALSQITAVDDGSTASYLYNGNDERVYKQTSGSWTDYVYFGGQPMSELDSTGTRTNYIFADGQKIAKVTSAGDLKYYLDDHLGTAQVEFDSSGTVTWQGQFTPFGAELPGSSTSMHYKFTGKERDAESGLDNFGARYYASATGRWMSPDWAEHPEAVPYSSLSSPQTLNLYGYVGNNPLRQADVDGHIFNGSGDDGGSTSGGVGGHNDDIKSEDERIAEGQKQLTDDANEVTNDEKDAMKASVDASNRPGGKDGSDTVGGFHEESGYAGAGYFGGSDIIVSCLPGPVADTKGAHTEWKAADPNTAKAVSKPKVFWHVHPKGSSDHPLNQPPSPQDQGVATMMNTERRVTSIVLGAKDRNVYIYDGTPFVKKISFKDFGIK